MIHAGAGHIGKQIGDLFFKTATTFCSGDYVDLEGRGVEVLSNHLPELPLRSRNVYKDIDQVMDQQSDLVEREIQLSAIGVIRG